MKRLVQFQPSQRLLPFGCLIMKHGAVRERKSFAFVCLTLYSWQATDTERAGEFCCDFGRLAGVLGAGGLEGACVCDCDLG